MPDLNISLVQNPMAVEVARSADVGEGFWLRVWAEWGRDGTDPRRAIQVPLDVFLGNNAWFAAACRGHGVEPHVDGGVRQILEQRLVARASLSLARTAVGLTEEEVAARLAGSRFTRDLRPFQVRDVGHQLALSNGANFSVPGAGKTAVTYAVYEAERVAGRVARMLVVAPLSAFDAWFTEAQNSFDVPPVVVRFDSGDIADAEVLLVNYHRLVNSYAEVAAWANGQPTMVVLDEAHRMKRGWSGQWGKYCLSLAMLAARRDILTGTPAPQAPGDLEALFDFLWPGQARQILPAEVRLATPPPDIGHRVAEAIGPLFTRTTKPELGLPPVRYSSIVVPLEGLQGEIYEALRTRFSTAFDVSQADRLDLSQMGRIVMYLLEAATNPRLLPVGDAEADVFRHPPLEIPDGSRLFDLIANYAQHETPAKFIELAKIVRDNAALGRKTLVWTNFVRNILVLREQFARYQPATIYGGVPSAPTETPGVVTRESELRRFREDDSCMVLVANPAAMSEGVSLHDVCHDAVYLDRTFNAGHYLQSLDRIHRLGLPAAQETRISILITDTTIDDVVDSRIRVKADRLSAMLSDPAITLMALPDDEDYGTPVDTGEDLVALFAHLRGDDGHD